MASMSWFGSVVGSSPYSSTRIFTTVSDMKAGRVGPEYIFLTPRAKSVRSMHTDFCSYHDSTKVRGRSFTEQPVLPAVCWHLKQKYLTI